MKQTTTVNGSQAIEKHVHPRAVPSDQPGLAPTAERSDLDLLDPSFFDGGNYFQEELDGLNDASLDFGLDENHQEGVNQSFLLSAVSIVATSSPLLAPVRAESMFDVLDLEIGNQPTSLPFAETCTGDSRHSFRTDDALSDTRLPAAAAGARTAGTQEVEVLHAGQVARGEAFPPEDLRSIRYYIDRMFPATFPFLDPGISNRVCRHLLAALRESKILYASIIAQSVYCQQSQLRRFGLTSADFEQTSTTHERVAIQGLYDKLQKCKLSNDNFNSDEGLLEIQVCTNQVLLSQVSFLLCAAGSISYQSCRWFEAVMTGQESSRS